MIPTIPVTDAVLGAARALDPVKELEGQNNRGYFPDAINDFCGSPRGSSWCLNFCHYVGVHTLGSVRWPLGRDGNCDHLLQLATRRDVLGHYPEPGAIFLKLNPDDPADATHAGFVDRVRPDGSFTTVEGNSNTDGSSNGTAVVRITRPRKHGERYVFVYWWKLIK